MRIEARACTNGGGGGTAQCGVVWGLGRMGQGDTHTSFLACFLTSSQKKSQTVRGVESAQCFSMMITLRSGVGGWQGGGAQGGGSKPNEGGDDHEKHDEGVGQRWGTDTLQTNTTRPTGGDSVNAQPITF